MSEPISGVAGGAMSQHLDGGAKQARQQAGGASFESVLQQNGQNSGEGVQTTGTQAPPASAPAQELGQVPEAARQDLLRRVGSLPPGAPNVLALLPDLFSAKKQTNWIREALNGVGNSPRAADLRGSLGNLEQQWSQLDSVLKSGKDMTQADLLVLQGRLYQLTQHVEVLSKVVDQVTGGVKTILNTNV
jgi:hypothetical protein